MGKQCPGLPRRLQLGVALLLLQTGATGTMLGNALHTALNHHNPPRHCLQMGVALLVVELNRKNKEDAAKKEKDLQEKEQIRELHERHLHTEKVS